MAKQYRKVLDETFGTKVEIIEDIEADPGAAEPASPGESSNALNDDPRTDGDIFGSCAAVVINPSWDSNDSCISFIISSSHSFHCHSRRHAIRRKFGQ